MERLTPIPIPLSQRWKEFRLKGIPILVFSFCVITATHFWKQNVSTTFLAGEAEAIQASITAQHPGTLAELKPALYDEVAQGQVIGQIITTPPSVVEASLGLIQAEIEVIKNSMSPLADSERNALALERLKLSWLNQRIHAATSKIRLAYAEAQFERNSKLYAEHLVSDAVLENSKLKRDRYKLEAEEHNQIASELEPALEKLKAAGGQALLDKPQDALRTAIKVQEEKLRLTEAQLAPVALKAPITGRVSSLLKKAGENVSAGEAILTITAERPEKISAYVRQPVLVEPRKGMKVEIITRTPRRERAESSVAQVGVRWQPVSHALLRTGATFETGLPILINIPAGLKLRPGELVDLAFKEADAPATK